MIALTLLVAGGTLAAPSDPVAPPPLPISIPVLLREGTPDDSGFNYDYVDLNLSLGDLDGLRIAGSKHLSGQWLAIGRFDWLTEERGSRDVDVLILALGGAYVHTVEEDELDVIGSLEIEIGDVEVSGGGGDDDDVGFRARGGARYWVNDDIEVAGGIYFTTLFDEDLGVDGRGLYHFNDNWAAFLGFEWQDSDYNFFQLGVRYSF